MSETMQLVEEYRAAAMAHKQRGDVYEILLALLIDHVGGRVKIQRKAERQLDGKSLQIDLSKKTMITMELVTKEEQ